MTAKIAHVEQARRSSQLRPAAIVLFTAARLARPGLDSESRI